MKVEAPVTVGAHPPGRSWRRCAAGPTRPWVIAVVVVAVGVVGFGLYWFQPWKLWQDETVQEALPGVAEMSAPPAAAPSEETFAPPSPATGPQMVASGELISHEHATSGTVKLVRLADGSHVVRLENLDTSNGPDLRVWLTDAQGRQDGMSSTTGSTSASAS